jgi:hypothetical protein
MFDGWREFGAGVLDVLAVAEKSPDALLGLDIGALTDGGLIDAMTSARRLTSRLQAVELAAVAELVRRRAAEDVDPRVEAVSPRDYVHDEVAEALTLTAGAADDLIRAKARRLVRRLDPGALARRRANAERQRSVQVVDTDDGTAHLTGADLPADAARAAYNRVNAIATGLKCDGDQRGIGQLRADVFLALLRGTLTTTEPPAGSVDRPLGESAASTNEGWTGVDDAVAEVIARAARERLSEFAGQLPERHRELPTLIAHAGERITASLAGLKANWCVPPHDRVGYRVPAGMRRLIEHRDRRCGFPGCRRPVRHCDADHSIPFHRGGITCPCNVAMLCRRHHRVKQTDGWRLEHLWPGVLLWIGPTGHWRITAPADRE